MPAPWLKKLATALFLIGFIAVSVGAGFHGHDLEEGSPHSCELCLLSHQFSQGLISLDMAGLPSLQWSETILYEDKGFQPISTHSSHLARAPPTLV